MSTSTIVPPLLPRGNLSGRTARFLDALGPGLSTGAVNGVVAVPVMVSLVRLASRRAVMRRFRLGYPLKAAAGMAVTSVI